MKSGFNPTLSHGTRTFPGNYDVIRLAQLFFPSGEGRGVACRSAFQHFTVNTGATPRGETLIFYLFLVWFLSLNCLNVVSRVIADAIALSRHTIALSRHSIALSHILSHYRAYYCTIAFTIALSRHTIALLCYRTHTRSSSLQSCCALLH